MSMLFTGRFEWACTYRDEVATTLVPLNQRVVDGLAKYLLYPASNFVHQRRKRDQQRLLVSWVTVQRLSTVGRYTALDRHQPRHHTTSVMTRASTCRVMSQPP